MALMFPDSMNFYSPSKLKDGELTVYELLKRNLPDEYIIYHRVQLVNKAQYKFEPDFIILYPKGIVILEVKDWSMSYMKSYNPIQVNLLDKENVKNPLVQAKEYKFDLINTLQSYEKLRTKNGKFKSRYTHIAVYPNIDEVEFKNNGINIIRKGKKIIREILTKDIIEEYIENPNKDKFIKIIEGCFEYEYNDKFNLNKKDIDIIREKIVKNIIIDTYKIENKIKVLDLQQEKIAKTMKYRQILINGAAGTGKTSCVISRSKYIAEEIEDFEILILCYNKFLKEYIQQCVMEYPNIEVATFNSFLYKILKNKKYDNDKLRTNPKIIKELCKDCDLSSAKKYNAILIDEGQDFELEWIEFIKKCLVKENKSHFVICSDSVQNIYSKNKFTLKGLVKENLILTKNYRNTKEIYEYSIEKCHINPQSQQMCLFDKDEFSNNNYDYYDNTTSIVDKGKIHNECFVKTMEEAIKLICDKIKEIGIDGCKLDDIAVIFPKKDRLSDIEALLKEKGISAQNFCNNVKSINFNRKVNIITPHSSKGMDFKVVFVINSKLFNQIRENGEKRLLFVALTRAREELYFIDFYKLRE